MNEEVHTAEWIVARLEGDTGPGGLFDPARNPKPTGAYYQVIPGSRNLPAIRFYSAFANDVQTVGAERIMVEIHWYITLVNEGLEVAPLVPLVDRIDALLDNSNGETSSLTVLECTRLSPFSLLEPDDSGVQYRHIGGLYRTMSQTK